MLRPHRPFLMTMRDGLIKAAQGHSVEVDLGLDPCQPPPVLHHLTVRPIPGVGR